ncbi:hypothetical protein A2Z00_01340 [Candidatus Gottesmanbacteria bacterium RBG_13_45_10]|uniref:EamA domain-containing protein n=1 Tax=Candidatus Gottesmanbacteria bacterium RBG_13_45_10 TaxID=1798370 RepID=A0A1F5ZGU1_9BACT|nr:MAG: hypothetical protein A2Z00_01340 [Candidatus Gottesmanbacteria bacterium RBG_13_45_10]
MSPKKIAAISLIIASIFWASAGAVSKILLVSFDPLSLALLRLTIASTLLLPLFLSQKRPPIKTLLSDCIPIGLVGTGNFLFFLLGVSRTTANASSIIYTATPILTLIVAHFAIKEHVTRAKIAGIILGLLGVVVILILPIVRRGTTINGDLIGNLFMIAAVLSWTVYIVGSRRLIATKHYNPLTITSVSMFTSFLIFLIATIVYPHRPILPRVFEGNNWILLLYFGACVTVVTYTLHQWAIKHSSATTASMTNYLQPVFALTFNAFLIGEKLTIEFLFGSFLVLAGTFLATSGQINTYIRRVMQKSVGE